MSDGSNAIRSDSIRCTGHSVVAEDSIELRFVRSLVRLDSVPLCARCARTETLSGSDGTLQRRLHTRDRGTLLHREREQPMLVALR